MILAAAILLLYGISCFAVPLVTLVKRPALWAKRSIALAALPVCAVIFSGVAQFEMGNCINNHVKAGTYADQCGSPGDFITIGLGFTGVWFLAAIVLASLVGVLITRGIARKAEYVGGSSSNRS